tara:strand:+ start:165 stop:362 length:198 start_codon:yes stop_codon:yes gene_type:complete
MNMTDTQSLYDNYLVLLNQHYQLLSESKTDAVGVLTESTVLQLESKIDELRKQLHNLNLLNNLNH